MDIMILTFNYGIVKMDVSIGWNGINDQDTKTSLLCFQLNS